jgi:cytochrome P450
VFGHLLFVKRVMRSLPRDVHRDLVFGEIVRHHFPREGIVYLDPWPAAPPIILITSAKLTAQAAQSNASVAADRPPEVRAYLRPLTGRPTMFDTPERESKQSRALFGKGFAAANVRAMVPGMVAECLVYRDKLRKHARNGDMFYLNPQTLRLTFDVIGRTVL